MPRRRKSASDVIVPAAPSQFAPPEPPQRSRGWRHLPEERWSADRIHPAPYNAKVRRMAPEKFAKLVAGLRRFGLAGTLNVRAEDGMLLGGEHRFRAARQLIDEIRAAGGEDEESELERIGVAGGLFRVSPILGIPDAEAAALAVLLNNREAQGDFDPMGLSELLSELDGVGFDVVDTGFDLVQVESLVTWEPDVTREGGAKSAGADRPRPEPGEQSATTPRTGKRKGGRTRSMPAIDDEATESDLFDEADYTLAARALHRLADAEPSSADAIHALADRFTAAANVAGAGPLTFEAPTETPVGTPE
jgi:hypothetical protein